PPKWVTKLGPRQFPLGPRRLYHYLCHFTSCECILYNYRLAEEFGVCERTMQYYLAWLRSHALIKLSLRSDPTRPLDPKGFKTIRRIYVQHYASPQAWLIARTADALAPKKRRSKPAAHEKAAWSDLTPAQFEARRLAGIKALFALKG
ncbi:MAG: hypothetical protein Q8O76_11655, partial [Chloroflexota bacterium]|nr:hypothetical protein [Chloroflexota bacterium]